MKRNNHIYFLIICAIYLLIALSGYTQYRMYNFNHLTPDDGLSNEVVRSIAQDKYGFIWLGTNYGLNRYDGVKVKAMFQDPDDSLSLVNNFIRSLYCDKRGRLWVGCDPGFCQYDYTNDKFIRYTNAAANIAAITEDLSGNIWAATSAGPRIVDTLRHTLQDIPEGKDSIRYKMPRLNTGDVFCSPEGKLYFATGEGILIYDPKTSVNKLINASGKASFLLPRNDIIHITADHNGYLWASCGYNNSQLVRINPDLKSSKVYDDLSYHDNVRGSNSIRDLFTDSKGRIWVCSIYNGLSLYDEKSDHFIDFSSDPAFSNSINSDQVISIYEDRSGIIWVGTEGAGSNYFHPDRGLFSVIQKNNYLNRTLPDNWCRAVAEDADKNLWLATARGVSIFDFKNGVKKNLSNGNNGKNVISNSSVRSLLYDKNGYVWIGTASGLDRYNLSAEKIEHYSERDGIPAAFTWFIYQLRNGKIIVGTSLGLYEYLPAENRFFNHSNLPALKKLNSNFRAFKEDKDGMWWIGSFSKGVLIYDPIAGKIAKTLNEDSPIKLSNNYINSFLEDEKGNMWIGTRQNLNYYQAKEDSIVVYGTKNGLSNSWICGLRLDKNGRLWIGTGKGLCVMNIEHKVIRVFGINDGLPTTQFNYQDAFQTSGGLFLFPSFKGFIYFRPEDFNWTLSDPPVYISSFKVLNKDFGNSMKLAEPGNIRLKYNQNFFSFGLIGLNYSDPERCWYAYKLDGFDKDWVFTKERIINYTNVPGGLYTFRYKASLDPDNWNVEEKQIKIKVGTIFYKTWWFILVAVSLILSGIIYYVQSKIRNTQRMSELKGKAQILEKEKAMVMYEGLKQQLNPHFLFNSLTSLSSLISVNPEMAGKFLDNLSKTYRYILKSRDSETVPLADEIKFAKNYVQLQKTRFEKGFEVIIDIPEEFYHYAIVPVTIQNLIENAIKHNIIDEETPLIINIFVEQEYLVVQNNLQKKAFVETSNKQGLFSLKSLYRYLIKRPVEINEEADYFTIKIPLL